MADNTRAENFLAERDDDKGIHIPPGASNCRRHPLLSGKTMKSQWQLTVLQSREISCALDLEHNDAQDILVGVKIEITLLLCPGRAKFHHLRSRRSGRRALNARRWAGGGCHSTVCSQMDRG